MTSLLIVEDGSGVETANAYVSEAYASTHHDLRGNTKWNDYSIPQKERAIVRACDYIDKRFSRKFRGIRMTMDQGLEWPRLSAFDDSGYPFNGDGRLPKQLQKAAAEYALRAALYMVLAPDPTNTFIAPQQSMVTGETNEDADAVKGILVSKSQKVGPVEQSIRYETSAQALAGKTGTRATQSNVVDDTFIPEYPEADLLIEMLLNPASMSARLARGD